MSLRDRPLLSTEYVAVDCETNGLGGATCELTEVGAVLVGGGELHESWHSVVRAGGPLGGGAPARPGDPTLHRDHPGDGGRRSAARGGAAQARGDARGAGAAGPQRPL